MEQQLGEFRFRTRKSLRHFGAWCVLVAVVSGLMFWWAAGGNAADISGNEIAIIALLMLLAFGFLLEFLAVRLDVYSEALVFKHLFGKQVVPFSPYMQLYVRRWRYGLLLFPFGRLCALELRDGDLHYRVPASFRHNERIAVVLGAYLFRHSMHMLNQIYDAGEVLDFGAVQLSRQHLTANGQSLPAADIVRYRIRGGRLKIYTAAATGRAKWRPALAVPLEGIANFRLLCRFIHLNDTGMLKDAYRVKRFLIF